jgi:hypothetical protein
LCHAVGRGDDAGVEPSDDAVLMLDALLEIRTNVRRILWLLEDEDEEEGEEEEDL